MKKLTTLALILVLMLSFVGCNKVVVGDDWLPQVMVDGIIYSDTGFESIVTNRKNGFDGEITSKVEQSQKPIENNQSNFGTGYGYQFGEKEGTVDLYIDGMWVVYATDEVREQLLHPEPEPVSDAIPSEWGLVLETQNVTKKGLSLLCHHSSGENVFELQTGSYYVIQRSDEAGWVDVEYISQEHDVDWTAEAWIIQKESTTHWDVNWEGLYGELPAGEYRIGKEIMNFRGTGDYEEGMLYADFTIK